MIELGRFLIKLLIVGLLVCFGIFYGVDLATHGISEIHGPLDPSTEEQSLAQTAEEEPVLDHLNEVGLHAHDRLADLDAPYDPTLVNVLADATGDVLQRTARGGIELIVSLFDGILH